MEKGGNQTKIKVGIKWHALSAYKNDDAWSMQEFDQLEQISKAIENAQQCILENAKREVAPDIIEINICSPDATDLTLIDLPGIVRSVGKGESESLVQEIALLIDAFLRNERCIILAVVPANVDFHNSQIMADAIKVDPKTCRTIPVITKPDLIDPGAEAAVKELLLGNKKEFTLGFHMIKCRGQKALNDEVTVRQGLEQEDQFFKSTGPWRDIADRSLFGVDSLRDKLSALQVRMIEDSIPSIMTEVAQKKLTAAEELKRLGQDLSTDAMRRECFNQVIDSAVRFVEEAAAGKGGYKLDSGFGWRANVECLYTDFASEVMSARLAKVALIEEGSPVYVTDASGGEVQGVVYKIAGSLAYVDPDPVKTKSEESRTVFFAEKKQCNLAKGWKVGQKGTFNESKEPFIVFSIPADNLADSKVEPYRAIPLGELRACDDWLQQRMAKSSCGDLQCFLSAAVFNGVVRDIVRDEVAPLCWNIFEECCDQAGRRPSSRF